MKSKKQSKINLDDIYAIAVNYFKYFKFIWHIISSEEFIPNWHIEEIAKELQKLAIQIIDRNKSEYDLIINVPPGSTKSSLVTQAFITWIWIIDPTISVIISSYSSDLSITHSLKAKSIILHEDWGIFRDLIKVRTGKEFTLVKSTEKYWENNFGGWYYATSTGGSVTGKHAHLIIRDDPLNPEQAESKAEILKCNRFNDGTLSSRKKNKENTPTITVMQRLQEDDPTGHDLQKQDKGLPIRHVCLPAQLSDNVSPERLRDKYIDGLLDVKRLSLEVLQKEKIRLGSYAYAGQYLQRPAPEEGGIIKKEWFTIIEPGEVPSIAWDLWIDGAYTSNKDNDPTGLMMVGDDMTNGRIIIRNFESKWLGLPELLAYIPEYIAKHGGNIATMAYAEPKASGLDIINMLRKRINIKAITGSLVAQGKNVRAHYAAPFIESSRVLLVRGNWNEEYIHQMATFPNASHDEAIDLTAYACKKYLRNE